MAIDKGAQLLSDLVLYRTYSAQKADGTKESYEEVIDRLLSHHMERFPNLTLEIEQLRPFLLNKKVVPAMRWLQFAGEGIRREELRGFNCSYLAIESFQDIAEIFYILMCGTGVGYSVRNRHTSKLPSITSLEIDAAPVSIEDSKEGWANSVATLLANPQITFDYSKIRKAGEALTTGGTASGPESLQQMHESLRKILLAAEGRQLTSLEVHDIVCMVADTVVVGGVRRAALIALFDPDDTAMLTCKQGPWWETAPWRARANNSAALNRNHPRAKELFDSILEACIASNAGEPGIFWTHDDDWGGNPCLEISLRNKQTCNLSEVNLARCSGIDDIIDSIKAATILGTLQAAYTDFHYVSPEWKKNCDEEALLGVSLTGLAESWDLVANPPMLTFYSQYMRAVNREFARKLGINPAARIGCIKPSGSASAFLGTSSGIHAAHAPYYIRRVRIEKAQPLAAHLASVLPADFIETDNFNPSNYVISVPMKAADAIVRDKESALQLLERVKHIHRNWIVPSHNDGANTHNVSVTVNYKPEEVEDIKEWMWDNRECYVGISLLPYDGGTYQQAPFEAIDEMHYKSLMKKLPSLDLSKVIYVPSKVDSREAEIACAGGNCTWG
jgi:ribonucleoside-triphosphate reductase